MSTELYRKHRPQTFKGMVGQPDAVRVMLDMVKGGRVPHALLFTGPSGCGKTTLARILKIKLECSDIDFNEINAADFRGIDTIREIRVRMGSAPLNGKVRIWLVDEAHQLNGIAQNAFLKILEDTPDHVYFFLATTDPEKLIKTIITRCTEVRLKALGPVLMLELLKGVAEKEAITISDEVHEKIIEFSEGSPRKGLVLLNSVLHLEGEAEMLAAIASSDLKPKAFELCRALLDPRNKWPEVAPLVRALEGEDVEKLRHMVLGYAAAVLSKKNVPRAALMLQAFERPFYDSHRPGFVLACWEVAGR